MRLKWTKWSLSCKDLNYASCRNPDAISFISFVPTGLAKSCPLWFDFLSLSCLALTSLPFCRIQGSYSQNSVSKCITERRAFFFFEIQFYPLTSEILKHLCSVPLPKHHPEALYLQRGRWVGASRVWRVWRWVWDGLSYRQKFPYFFILSPDKLAFF